jgi:hypothetical protein
MMPPLNTVRKMVNQNPLLKLDESRWGNRLYITKRCTMPNMRNPNCTRKKSRCGEIFLIRAIEATRQKKGIAAMAYNQFLYKFGLLLNKDEILTLGLRMGEPLRTSEDAFCSTFGSIFYFLKNAKNEILVL